MISRLNQRLRRGALAAALLAGLPGSPARAQTEGDYSKAASVFPRIYQPFIPRMVPRQSLDNVDKAGLEVHDGKLRLTISQLVELVVENNLAVATARYYPSIAQVDLLRARSGSSPRGVDVASIPSGVFAGAEGGSILSSSGGGGGGSSNAGGITGSAGAVNIRPSGVFDPSLRVSFSVDHTTSPLNTLVVAGVPSVTTGTVAASVSYVQAFPTGTSFTLSYGAQRQSFHPAAPALRSGLHSRLHRHHQPAVGQWIRRSREQGAHLRGPERA